MAATPASGPLTGASSRSGSSPRALLRRVARDMRRPYAAARGRQAALLNRDIIKLFSGLRVSDSFLLKNNLREILFRKPS